MPRYRKKRAEALLEEGVIDEEQAVRLSSDDMDVVQEAREEVKQQREAISIETAVKIELARREMARRSLLHYTLRNVPGYQPGWVHREICEKLEKFREDVLAGKSPRLAIFMPPRHGKTELVRQFISQTLGQHPHLEFITCSYAASLQEDNSKQIQNLMRTGEWKALFPGILLDPKRQAVSDWKLQGHPGGMLAVGVGGPITGRGAHVLVIDDPVKNREEADSEVSRQSTWNWYTSTAYTRLMPGAGVLVIQTRWHDDDLSGRILRQQEQAQKIMNETGEWPSDIDRWEVIEYPALAFEEEEHRQPGMALHEERYDTTALKRIKRTIGPRDWAALYQQNPVADEGAYFKKDNVHYYDSRPNRLNYYTAADLAISKKESADYSVVATVGVDEHERYWLVDLRRGRWDSEEIIDNLIQTYHQWKPKTIGIEAGQIEKAIGPFLDKRIREERLYSMYVEPLPPGRRDKEMRARPLQGLMGQKKFFIPRNEAWTEGLVRELLRFPTGVHDDQVDALAWIGQMIQSITPAQLPRPPVRKSWKDNLHKFITGSSGGYDPMAA